MKRLLEQFAHKVLRNPIYQSCAPLRAPLNATELEKVLDAAREGMNINFTPALKLEEIYIIGNGKGKELTTRNKESCLDLFTQMKDLAYVAVTYRIEDTHLFSGVVITPRDVKTTFGYRIDSSHAPKAPWKVASLDEFHTMQKNFFLALQMALYGKATSTPSPALK
ncbi:MAG TPA: hypothetical protein VIN59_03535 [Alphaproteobacteria bacterium]